MLLLSIGMVSFSSFANRKEIREIDANDRVMKTINLTLGRSTILSFHEKPVKVVAGNSNYFNVEYIGNDLTIQPLANVETNLFVYTQSKNKYGFHLKVGSSVLYDDIVYVRWKSPYLTNSNQSVSGTDKPQKMLKSTVLKIGTLEVMVHKFLRLKGTRTYFADFEVKNKGIEEIKLNLIDIFASRNNERITGQKLFFDKEALGIHATCRGRLFLPIAKDEDFSFYILYKKKLERMVISKTYL
jgi:hypothetical protein